MFRFHKHHLGAIVVIAALLAAAFWWWPGPRELKKPKLPTAPALKLSMFAERPDWSGLSAFQRTMTRAEFERLLSTVFTAGEGWREWIEIGDEAAAIQMQGDEWYRLEFKQAGVDLDIERYWSEADELGPAPVGRPLYGSHIAIDPGHLGGEWAKMEARWLVIGEGKPICEGDMTLMVARLLKLRLESLGAKVSLVRDSSRPATDQRPEDFMALALEQTGDELSARKLAEKWFYRTAEIRARAELVNHEIQPDVVLALHFNADAWGDPQHPALSDHSHCHVLVHGGYGDDEVELEDQRYQLMVKLLSRTHRVEAAMAGAVSRVFEESTSMEMFEYSPGFPSVAEVEGQPGVWARNLLANRLYNCPVVFLEPYVMNSQPDYPRMQAGDYVGVREIAGKLQPSIFREYAEIVCAGVVRHYRAQRGN